MLRKAKSEQHMYCQGKKPHVLKAAWKYIEGLIDEPESKGKHKSLNQICFETGVSVNVLRERHREIMKLLNIEGIEP